jgi:hypothetical protein
MGRPRKVKPLPDYLEELMLLLEAQTEPDRQGAIQEIEERHGRQIDLAAEQDEYEEFAAHYARWWSRITMGLEDAAVNKALKGRGSASAALKEVRAIQGGGGRGGGGRLVLEKHHEARVAGYRRGW